MVLSAVDDLVAEFNDAVQCGLVAVMVAACAGIPSTLCQKSLCQGCFGSIFRWMMVGAGLRQQLGSLLEIAYDEFQYVSFGIQRLYWVVDHLLVVLEKNVRAPSSEQIEISPSAHEIALAHTGVLHALADIAGAVVLDILQCSVTHRHYIVECRPRQTEVGGKSCNLE